MPVAFVAAGAGTAAFASSAETDSFDAGAGDDRAFFLGAGVGSPFFFPAEINEARYGGSGGTVLTQLGADVTFNETSASAWFIAPGPSGSTTGWAATSASNADIGVGALAFSGADQTTPFGSLQSNSGRITTTSGRASITVTGVSSGDMVAGVVIFDDNAAATTSISAVSGTDLRASAIDGYPQTSVAAVTGVAAGSTVTLEVDVATGTADFIDWIFLAAPVNEAAGGVTGALAYTNANDTLSASGSPVIAGTSATTNANDTSAASGTTTVVGSSSTTNANDTLSAAGTTTVTGTLATTNADDTLAASGSVGAAVTGTLAYTNVNDASAAAGTTTIVGSGSTTNANDTSAGAGTTTIIGTLATTNSNDTLAASGVVGSPTGSLAYTNLNDTLAAAGSTPQANLGGAGFRRYVSERKRREAEQEETPVEATQVSPQPDTVMAAALLKAREKAQKQESRDIQYRANKISATIRAQQQDDEEVLMLLGYF